MSIQRRYSKAKAVGNHVVWTNEETIAMPFVVDGLVPDNQEFGVYRVSGRDQYCVGLAVNVNVPAKSGSVQLAIGIYNGQGVLAPGTLVYLTGNAVSANKCIMPPVAMPKGSVWKLIVQVASPNPNVTPQGLVATYYFRYANGQAISTIATYGSPS